MVYRLGQDLIHAKRNGLIHIRLFQVACHCGYDRLVNTILEQVLSDVYHCRVSVHPRHVQVHKN